MGEVVCYNPDAATTSEAVDIVMSNDLDFLTASKFYFETPLYSACSITYEQAENLILREVRCDGYCSSCRRESTFAYRPQKGLLLPQNTAGKPQFTGTLAIACARVNYHSIAFNVRIMAGKLLKVGQYPSFADIALDESKQYSGLLSKDDAGEFHKSIGLAAHGVGIGSYVYIRRIFERLIQQRFDEFKTAEGWSEDEFKKLRMAERIDFLKDHLPNFLVRNKRIYSIVSLGIHELDEDTCLSFFEVLKTTTVVILARR